MNDPAVEAGRRVCPGTDSPTVLSIFRIAEAGAREALKPIRELHKPHPGQHAAGSDVCGGCRLIWPCETARLVYTSEELGCG